MIDSTKIPNWRPLPHLFFWAASLYFIGSYFSVSGTLSSIDIIYAISFHLCLVPLVYLNLGLLVPRALQKRRYFFYLTGLVLSMALTIAIHHMVFEILIPMALVDYYIVSFVDTFSLLVVFGLYLAVTSLLKFSKSWFRIQQLEKENIRFELGALKEQLNPHFLFNGLNSIYALSLQKSEKTSEAILILSELLRFSLYEINKEKVLLTEEIKNVEHYLTLQKLRLQNPELVNFSFKGNPGEYLVPPMLFLPILENAFKHGDLKKEINISLEIEQKLRFRCENYIDKKDHPDKQSGGIGLENIKRRLDLLSSDHSLDIDIKDSQFLVKLEIENK